MKTIAKGYWVKVDGVLHKVVEIYDKEHFKNK